MRVLWLPAVLREAGLTVHEVSGWKTRGSSQWGMDTANASHRQPLRGVVCHATAGSRSSTTAGEIGVLINGSPSAPPPIAQLYLARDGDWHVVASGRCNHALTGWAGPLKGWGNYQLIGVEAGNDNRGEPWPAVQRRSYERGVAAICRHLELPASRVAGHKEHQPFPPPSWTTSTKSDPHGIDMDAFRAAVARLIEEDDMDQSEILRHTRYNVAFILRDTWRNAERALEQLAEVRATVRTLAGEDQATVIREELDRHRQLVAEQRQAEHEELAELVRQGQSGELEAAEVVRLIGERLITTTP